MKITRMASLSLLIVLAACQQNDKQLCRAEVLFSEAVQWTDITGHSKDELLLFGYDGEVVVFDGVETADFFAISTQYDKAQVLGGMVTSSGEIWAAGYTHDQYPDTFGRIWRLVDDNYYSTMIPDSHDMVVDLVSTSDGELYAAVDMGEYEDFDAAVMRFVDPVWELFAGAPLATSALTVDESGALWLGTGSSHGESGAIMRFDGSDWQEQELHGDGHCIDWVYDLEPLPGGGVIGVGASCHPLVAEDAFGQAPLIVSCDDAGCEVAVEDFAERAPGEEGFAFELHEVELFGDGTALAVGRRLGYFFDGSTWHEEQDAVGVALWGESAAEVFTVGNGGAVRRISCEP